MNRKGVAVLAMMAIIWGATLMAYGVRRLVVPPSPAADNVQKGYHVTMPDNTVLKLPEKFSLKEFLCIADNSFCFPNDNTSLYRRQRRGDIELWRI